MGNRILPKAPQNTIEFARADNTYAPIPRVDPTQDGLCPKLTNTGQNYLRDDGTWQPAAGGTGGGDMTKAIYDKDGNGVVDTCDALAWSKVTGTPATYPSDWNTTANKPASFSPSAHAASHNKGGADAIAPDWTQIANKPASFTPAAHASTHNLGGADAIAPDWTQIANKPATYPPDATAELVAHKGQVNGYAGLDSTGKVPSAQLPAAGSVPLADTTQPGLLTKVSGLTTDYIGGDNACHGLVAALAALLVPTGAFLDFAGSTAPNGFLLCNGALVSRTTYATLFSVIGTTYGAGDGSTTFALPDARGRTRIGAGQGTGLTNRALAATGGEEAHALSVAEEAVHTHTVPAHNHDLMVYITGGASPGWTTSQALGYSYQVGTGGVTAEWIAQQNGSGSVSTAPAFNTTNAGSGTAHNNMQPFLAANVIIKT